MNKSRDFLEFVKNNPPPCLPDAKPYWFDDETGGIRQSKYRIHSLVLTSDWEWKVYESDTAEFVVPNENSFLCTTPEAAKKFRDMVERVKFVIYRKDEKGTVVIENERYSYFKDDSFTDLEKIPIDEDYFSVIKKMYPDMEEGTVIILFTENGYILGEDGKFKECLINSLDKRNKRILEDVFEEDQ